MNNLLTLAPVFTDHAILQRGKPLPVWGIAAPGAIVKAGFAGATAETLAAPDGRFSVLLPAQKAGGPFELAVEMRQGDAREKIVLTDLFVGEVWLASGQSNMEFTFAQLGLDAEAAQADDCAIRIWRPLRNWQPVTPEAALHLPAVPWYFAQELRKRLRVPVGILVNAVGGSSAEAWLSRESAANLPFLRPAWQEYELLRDTEAWRNADAAYRALQEKCRALSRLSAADNAKQAANDSGFSDPVELPAQWKNFCGDFNGVVRFRRSVEIPPEWEGRDLLLSIGAVDKHDITTFNGVEVGRTGRELQHDFYNVPRRYPVPGKLVRRGANLIDIRAASFAYDGGVTGPAELMYLACGTEKIPLSGAWRYRIEHHLGKMSPLIDLPRDGNDFSVLFESLTRPLIPYAIRGVIWYQGCSNTLGPMITPTTPKARQTIGRRPAQYGSLMTELITDWRRRWGQGMDLPFLQMQLAGFGRRAEIDVRDRFAIIRQEQYASSLATGNIPVTAWDIGESDNIHPRNKREAGKRLAYAALVQAYGKKWPASGPVFTAASFRDGRLTLTFRDADGLHARSGRCRGFALSQDGRRYRAAAARIENATVVIDCPGEVKPSAVRFAWAGCPDADLYNAAGLPAYPFECNQIKDSSL